MPFQQSPTVLYVFERNFMTHEIVLEDIIHILLGNESPNKNVDNTLLLVYLVCCLAAINFHCKGYSIF